MRILTIAFYTLKVSLKERGAFFEMLLLPIVLILILGSALSMGFQPARFTRIPVAFVNEDRSLGGYYLADFLALPDIAEMLEVTTLATLEEGKARLEDRKVFAVIHIDEAFTQDVFSDRAVPIYLYANPGSSYGRTLVESILEAYTVGANVVDVVRVTTRGTPDFVPKAGLLEEISFHASGHIPRAIDYYAVTMLIMTLWYGAFYGAYGMGNYYLGALGERVRATTLSSGELFVGKTLGFLCTLLAQGSLIIAFTSLVYKVNWGENLLWVLLVVLLFSFFAVGFGIMLCMVTRNQGFAARIINVVVPASTLVAGGYVAIERPGILLSLLQWMSPSFYGHTALFNIIYGGPKSETLFMISFIAGLTITTFIIASVAGRRSFA